MATHSAPPLFAPAGKKYAKEDYERISNQQPIPLDEIAWYLFPDELVKEHPNHVPPRLWCGWRTTEEHILQFALTNFPDTVVNCSGKPHFYDTIFEGTFLNRLRKECQIPDEDASAIRVVQALRPGRTWNEDFVLSIGSTDEGILEEHYRSAVARWMGFSGEEPQWHLDADRAHWMVATTTTARQKALAIRDRRCSVFATAT